MMPLNWIILFIMFNLIFYIFLINNYFNLNFTDIKSTSLKSHDSKPLHNFWPLN
uniref:ATP synthase F0 subunit 8 n=1 Tax=Pseudostenophylax fumosus TaxID=1875925 RepID=UPI0022DCE1B9|nr:ATP synthase F0 subunit 8 [Pseudostenophylax fumosus]UZZ44315.1 ATP synthase F0 subunit 8 [Pseudostenophylax fumosus]